jgi:lipoprotein-anchoring transpeptidase ErfK/SrfK
MAYSIIVSTATRRLILQKNGQTVKSYPVGVGRSGSPSPSGTFYIVNKRPHPGGPYGVMWMGLSIPGYGIHGTNNPSSIGGYVSKGCIRMYNKDVIDLSMIVPVGTPVTIRAY